MLETLAVIVLGNNPNGTSVFEERLEDHSLPECTSNVDLSVRLSVPRGVSQPGVMLVWVLRGGPNTIIGWGEVFSYPGLATASEWLEGSRYCYKSWLGGKVFCALWAGSERAFPGLFLSGCFREGGMAGRVR